MAAPESKPIRAFSHGGGVQSTAALVLAATGAIDYPLFVFANTGDDSEHPDTLAYVREIAMPYAAANGVELVERQKRRRGGEFDTLVQRMGRGTSTVPIPMRLGDAGAPGNRTCTDEFKIRVVAAEVRARGATADNPARVGLGITTDEYKRMRSPTDPRQPAVYREYPLIDLRLFRDDCLRIIADASLPEPPKSACLFCPFQTMDRWRRLRENRPDLFEKSEEIEAAMQDRRSALGLTLPWMTRYGSIEKRRLGEVVQTGQLEIDDDNCDSGFCMT